VANRLDCKKRVVEDCIKLSVVDLRAKDIFSMRFKECWISWISNNVNHKVHLSIEESPGQAMALRFSQPSMRCLIEVTAARACENARLQELTSRSQVKEVNPCVVLDRAQGRHLEC